MKANLKKINEKTLIVAVDLGKLKHVCRFISISGFESKPIPIYNNRASFEQLWQKALMYKSANNLDTIMLGVEPTGSYGFALMEFFKNKGAEIRLVNPMHTKRLKDMIGNSPQKTDEKDPLVIGDILKLGRGLSMVMPEGVIADLRHLVNTRENILEDINRVKNHLESLICIYFPEFFNVMKNLRTKTSIYILNRYPFPKDIVKVGKKKLTEEIRKVSRGQIKAEKVTCLYECANNSIGVKQGHQGIKVEIKMLLDQHDLLEQQKQNIEKTIRQQVGRVPYMKIITSIKGIKEISAAAIIAEVADFMAFRRGKEVEKLAGLNLYEVSSGKHKGEKHISKRGRPLLRKTLFFVTLNLVRKDGIFHQEYQNHRSKGMPGPKALTAISRKLLRTIHAMIRDNKCFDENYVKSQNNKMAAKDRKISRDSIKAA